ncbi:MAG: hypothetical protein IPL31_03835 [Saprospiraceae bacterium]|nr:hypothetical protein [Saprospiraceae bacterium]
MRQYNLEDFRIGDSVFHKSNTRIRMIVIRKNSESLELTCRWIDKDGNKLEEDFLFAELIKSDDFIMIVYHKSLNRYLDLK